MCFPSEHKFASVDKPHTLWGLQWKPGNKIWQYLDGSSFTPRASHSPAVATAADASVPAAYLVTGTKTNKGSLRKEEFSGLTAPGGKPSPEGWAELQEPQSSGHTVSTVRKQRETYLGSQKPSSTF